MLKYYWNQMCFFGLKQGPLNQEPTLYKIVRETIITYQNMSESKQPVWFNIAQSTLTKDLVGYKKRLQEIIKVLYQDVSWRFLIIDGEEIPLYQINKQNEEIILNKTNHKILPLDGYVLTPFIYLKWAQLLEKFNRSPKIANKVAGSGQQEIKRKSLSVYRETLLKLFENQPIKDFYTDESLNPNEISIDHFIPWSYIYSDDIWNLVITSKSNNSKKLNRFSSIFYLKKLVEQNYKLLPLIQDPTTKEIILEAIQHQYLEKFYNDLRII